MESAEKIMQMKHANGVNAIATWALTGMIACSVGFAASGASVAQSLSPSAGDRPSQSTIRSFCTGCTVVREIDDPHSGQQWLLLRDPAHPGGPGVLASRDSVQSNGKLEGAIVRLHPAIRAGDRLTVEQSNTKFDLRLEGVALSPAALGGQFRVRLVWGGKVVEAVALAPGRAVESPEKEFWP